VRDFPLGDGIDAAINLESDEEEKEDPVEPSTLEWPNRFLGCVSSSGATISYIYFMRFNDIWTYGFNAW